MNRINAAFVVLVLGISHPACDSKKDGDQATGSNSSQKSKRSSRPEISQGERERRADYKNTPGLAMNRNAETREILAQKPPAWLTIGKPVTSTLREESDIEWPNPPGGMGKESFGDSQKISSLAGGRVLVPDSFASKTWAYSILHPKGNLTVVAESGSYNLPRLYRIEGGQLEENSAQEIPAINFDDKRRWFIEWESWLTDSEILGTVNEDDFSGHVTVRTVFYIYNVDSRELRRIETPVSWGRGSDSSVTIDAVSPDALRVIEDGKTQVISLGR